MNHKKLQVHREDLINRALDIINENEPLRAKWKSCFHEEENDTSKVSEALSLIYILGLSRNVKPPPPPSYFYDMVNWCVI